MPPRMPLPALRQAHTCSLAYQSKWSRGIRCWLSAAFSHDNLLLSQPAICKSERQKTCQMVWGSESRKCFYTICSVGLLMTQGTKARELRCEDLQGCKEFHWFTTNNVPQTTSEDHKSLNYPSFSKLHFGPCLPKERPWKLRGIYGGGGRSIVPTCCSNRSSALQLNTVKLSGNKIKMESQNGKESQTRCNYTHFYISLLNFNAFYGPLNKWIIQDS